MTTKPLSPAAQAVLEAAMDYTPTMIDARLGAAAALQAAADQVVPVEPSEYKEFTNEAVRLNRMGTRAKVLAIAAELEGANL